jgi:hypothetical protein
MQALAGFERATSVSIVSFSVRQELVRCDRSIPIHSAKEHFVHVQQYIKKVRAASTQEERENIVFKELAKIRQKYSSGNKCSGAVGSRATAAPPVICVDCGCFNTAQKICKISIHKCVLLPRRSLRFQEHSGSHKPQLSLAAHPRFEQLVGMHLETA